MLKHFLDCTSAGESLATQGPSVEAASPVTAVALLPPPCFKDEFTIDPSQQASHLTNFEMLNKLNISWKYVS